MLESISTGMIFMGGFLLILFFICRDPIVGICKDSIKRINQQQK
jgi:hypothetical protein